MSEQTAQSWWMGIVGAVIVLSIAGVGGAMYTKLDRVEQAQTRFGNEQAGMKKDIEWMKLSMTDVYTQKQADRKHAAILRTDQDQYERLDKYHAQIQRNTSSIADMRRTLNRSREK